ncbi:MAG: glycosyltransferase family 4 protein [Candidatus Magasanikbacteria bacterium]
MRIAHIVCTYPPYYGGMGNVVFQTISHLSDLGHEVEVITPLYYHEEEKFVERQEDIDVGEHIEEQEELQDYGRRLKPSLQYGNAARLSKISKELDKFDLVHLHYPFFGTANLVRKWKLKNPHKPLVITYHMDTRAPGWKGLIFKYYSKFWMPKILNSADALIVSSFDYAKSSNAGELFKQNRDKWHELPFGVDLERFKPREKTEALIENLGVSTELPIVLFVGGMDRAHYFKGVPVLLRALAELKKKETPVQCVLVGDGDLKIDFEMQAKVSGLSELVKFVGNISIEELPNYFYLADLLVLPSINQGEAFGMVLLEAMASGIPVIASDLPGVRSVAKDGGMLVGPNDFAELSTAIYNYFAEDIDREKFSKDVRQLAVDKYDWQKITGELDNIYQQLAKK